MRMDREDRGYRMVQNLGALGYALDWERVLAIAAGGAVGRPHVAEAMLERGYVASVQDAFDRFLGRDGPAYAERPKLLTTNAVAFVRRFGGLAVVAHPFDGPQDLEALLH
jgi:predicted metal-dependent phosphoesterase TrpH